MKVNETQGIHGFMMNEKITHNKWMSRTKKKITKTARIDKDFQNQQFFTSFFILSICKSTSGFASQLFQQFFSLLPFLSNILLGNLKPTNLGPLYQISGETRWSLEQLLQGRHFLVIWTFS